MENPVKFGVAEKINWWPGRKVRDIQLDALEYALEYYDGNKTHAAKSLGVCVRTVRLWMGRHSRFDRYRGMVPGAPNRETPGKKA